MESLFNKFIKRDFVKKRLQHRRFPKNIAKFLRPAFYKTPSAAAFGVTSEFKTISFKKKKKQRVNYDW